VITAEKLRIQDDCYASANLKVDPTGATTSDRQDQLLRMTYACYVQHQAGVEGVDGPDTQHAAADEVASHLFVHKNPDYGTLTASDLAILQNCKDRLESKFEFEIKPPNLPAGWSPTIDVGRLAAAIEGCAIGAKIDGLHVEMTEWTIEAPLLH